MMLGLTGCKNKNEEVVDNALVDVQNQEVSDEDVEEAIRNREFEDAKNLTLNNKNSAKILKNLMKHIKQANLMNIQILDRSG